MQTLDLHHDGDKGKQHDKTTVLEYKQRKKTLIDVWKSFDGWIQVA